MRYMLLGSGSPQRDRKVRELRNGGYRTIVRELCGRPKLPMLRKLLRNLVDLEGFEPSTSSMPWKRAPNCATGPAWVRLYYASTLFARPTTPSSGELALAYSLFGILPAR